MSVVVACDGLDQRGAGLAPPDVLGAAAVGGPAGLRTAFNYRGEHKAQLADRLLPVGQLPEQAAHQLVDGGRAGAEGPRFGGGLGEDVFIQVLEVSRTVRPQRRARPGPQRLELVGAGSDPHRFAQLRLAGGGSRGSAAGSAWTTSPLSGS
ncbi:hypothetical protein [Streptomyces cyaneofuscatus]|uniref:hypothetical protein n=1 Tax=Streptomyces cyaneofuscatus TaxID=66883 RepID=UPI002F918EFB|nr:hypothetical protein OG973_36730 [Streptomyces cyaneofuscatus]